MCILGTALISACAGTAPMKGATPPRPGPTLGDLSATSQPVAPQAAGTTDDERERAIAAYRAYLAQYPDSPEYQAITRRLADLMVEQAADLQAVAPASPEGLEILKRNLT